MGRRFILGFFLLASLAIGSLISIPNTNDVSALTTTGNSGLSRKFALWDKLNSEEQDIFSQNNIIFYDPTECDTNSGSGQQMEEEGDSYDGIPTAGLSDLQSAFVDKWHNTAAKWSVVYGIPWETVVAQGILESASGTSNFAKYRNNFFGIGAFDSNPDNAYRYATASEGWQGYFENIRKTPTYRQHGVFKEPNITDPLAYLKAIKAAGYATDPKYVTKVGSLVKAIQKRSKEKGWDSSEALAKKHPEMLTNAAKYASGAGSSPTAESKYTSKETNNSGNGGNAGEAINKSALKLAWPEGQSHAKNDPTSEYKKVLKESKLSQYGDANVEMGASCDAFVKSVLWHSGVDKNFECCGVGSQVTYLEKHPEIFTEIKDWSWEKAKPGDIVVKSNEHIMLAVEVNGKIKRADASYGERTGMIHNYYSGTFRVWRATGDVEQEDECLDDSAGAMDLNRTAIQLAWPADSGNHACSDVYPPFKEAALKVKSANFPSGCSCLGGSGCAVDHGSSCSVYVATVIRYSGVDPKMKIHNPGPMRDYMLTKPEIFEEVTSGYGKDTMRPGDIQVSEAHIRMLVQLSDGSFHISEASLGNESEGRPAKPGQINKKEYNGSLSGGYRVFRAKHGIQSSPASSGGSSGSSGSTNGSMNISQTALELAYGIDDPENKGQDTTAQPSPAYSKALDAVDGRSNYNGKGGCKWLGASCDSFVAVVLRYSGVDPKVSTALATQWTYYPSKTDLYEEVTEGYSKDNMQPGDIHIRLGGHVRVIAQLPDGKMHIVEAGYGNGKTTGSGHCKSGRVDKSVYDGSLSGGYRAFRAKANTNSNSAACLCQAEEKKIDNAVEGGMTDDQAKKLVAAYKKENGACNCVTLSNWFIKNMLGLSPVSGNGGDIAYNLAKTHNLDHGSEPRPYAIFGTDGSMAVSYCGAYKCGHTGVVVAVKGDDVTTIEAAWGNCGFTGVKHRKKSEFTSAKYGNNYVFTYTDSVLKKDELAKRIR